VSASKLDSPDWGAWASSPWWARRDESSAAAPGRPAEEPIDPWSLVYEIAAAGTPGLAPDDSSMATGTVRQQAIANPTDRVDWPPRSELPSSRPLPTLDQPPWLEQSPPGPQAAAFNGGSLVPPRFHDATESWIVRSVTVGPRIYSPTERVTATTSRRGHRLSPWPLALPATLALVILLAAWAALLSAPPPVRLPLGLLAVLLLPGSALVATLFPRADDLDGLERLALGIGLSLSVIAVLALGLNATPWGLRPQALIVGLTGWTLLASGVAEWRRQRTPPDERAEPGRGFLLLLRERSFRLGLGVLGGVVVLCATALWVTLGAPPPPLTEFYMLGQQGLAEGYPRGGAPGQVLAVTVGITDREGRPASYEVRAALGGTVLSQLGPIQLAAAETWEGPLRFSLPAAGNEQELAILLFKDGGAEPYRRLRLFLDVAVPTPTRRLSSSLAPLSASRLALQDD
jgi:uncharacterized membrane protein